MNNKNKLKSSVKFPTSLIIGGDDFLAVEVAKSLIEQGGYVIVIDKDSEQLHEKYSKIENQKLLTLLDYSSVEFLDDDLRRLDYVFYFAHRYDHANVKLSSKEFLQYSNYLDLIINLANKFEAKFLLTSSIKANQIIINSSGELDFHKKATEKHVVYSLVEMQRYAEALVFESIEKYKLDARIIRLGRVVGPGMDLDTEYSLDRLVMSAVMGKHFKLHSDGLDSNMYVHVLDAAYGVIKAMFSKGTEGKIFSVTNDEEITDLSIAYKLQELVGLDQEIKFDSQNSNYPEIRFYKPAKNLSTIGWIPRVSFERSLVQVFDYAKELYISEQEKQLLDGSAELKEAEEVIDDTRDEPQGALARLIAERKAQEKSRRASILMANEKVKERSKAKRTFTPTERMGRILNNYYDRVTQKLSFLKRITLFEMSIYVVVFLLFMILYLSFLAPAFVMVKDLAYIEYYKTGLERSMDNEEYGNISHNLAKISSAVTEYRDNYDRFGGLYGLLGAEDDFETKKDTLNALAIHIESINEAYSLNQDYYDYYENLDYSLIYRPTNDSVLDSGVSSVDEGSLSIVLANSVKANQLDKKIEITSEALASKEVGSILGYNFSSLNDLVIDLEDDSVMIASFLQNYSEYVLDDSTMTYAFVLQDESRYTPAGGYPAAIGYVTMRQGIILDIELTPYSADADVEFGDITDSEVQVIQNASLGLKSPESITLEDMFLIPDKSLIEDNIENYLLSRYGVEVQGVAFLDTQVLRELIDINGDLEVNQVIFRKDSFEAGLSALMRDDDSVDTKNQMLANIFANEIIEVLDGPDSVYQFVKKGIDLYESNSLSVYSTSTQLQTDLSPLQVDVADTDWLGVMPVVDSEVPIPNAFPNIEVDIVDEMNTLDEIKRSVSFKLGDTDDVDRLMVCMKTSAKNIDSDVDIITTFLGDTVCVSVDVDVKEFNLEYDLEPTIENLVDNTYNVSLGFRSSPGVSISYGYEISSDGYTLVPSENLVLSDGNLVDSGVLDENRIINISIQK